MVGEVVLKLDTIIPIIRKLEENNIMYSLGGSGLLYYLNLVESINDWDITVDCSKEELLKALNGHDCLELESGDYPFASQYRLSVETQHIDFIGGFALHAEKGILQLPLERLGEWNGIHMASPEVWYVAYYLMGRQSKADLLLHYLQNNACTINYSLIEDLLKSTSLGHELRQSLISLVIEAKSYKSSD